MKKVLILMLIVMGFIITSCNSNVPTSETPVVSEDSTIVVNTVDSTNVVSDSTVVK